VRFAVLKKTGHYSEHYHENETSDLIISEFIRLNIDAHYWAKKGPRYAHWHALSVKAHELFERINRADGA
jgi:hypothetical protein